MTGIGKASGGSWAETERVPIGRHKGWMKHELLGLRKVDSLLIQQVIIGSTEALFKGLQLLRSREHSQLAADNSP